MFTPQKKSPWTPIPPSSATRNEAKQNAVVAGLRSSAAEKKAVGYVHGPPPPPPPPPLNGGMSYDSGNMEDWRRFKEAGLLDPAALEMKDREALLQMVSRLEKELHDYQYNMGLLLIEKNDLTSNCEDLRHEVAEAREILKREQSAHLIAISDSEKRTENLKRALDLEKNCVVDLERAVHEMRDELEQIKTATNTDDTNARITRLLEERVEVDGKLHLANIRVAEADRKINELDVKLQELQAQEATLIGQHRALDTEREGYESKLKKQKEEFKIWERKLQEREERLHEQRRTLDEREGKLSESERRYKQKERDLDHLQKESNVDLCTLKQREDDVSKRLNELASKEKEVEALRLNLEQREKQLHALEERLSDKERVEIQKQVDEHRAILETKSEELELEMQQKRNTLHEEVKTKLNAIEKKEVEVNHQEAKLAKMEQALREKSQRVQEKEKKLEEKSKALKVEESCLKSRENKLDEDRKHLSADRENLHILKAQIEKLRDELKSKELLIQEENEKFKSNEEMRSEHIRLQSRLNEEMEKWRNQNELLMKEKEDLGKERRKVEKDWEALDEKRATVEKELKKLEEEKERFERATYLEEEKLKKEKIEIDERIEQELESLRLEKESFDAKMKHEQLTLTETARNEREQIVQEFEQQRRELENRVQKQEEDLEKDLQEKEMAFEEKRSREMRNINQLKELAEKQKEEMESGWLKVKKAKEELAFSKRKLEEDQREIHKDISSLGTLSKKLKEQRQQLLNERAHFVSFVEKLKACQTCGDFTNEFVVSDLHLPAADVGEALPLPQSVDHLAVKISPEANDVDLSESGGQKSWLKKCASKIFQISSIKRTQDDTDQFQEETPTSALHPSVDKTYTSLDEDESKLPFQGPADRQDPSASISDAFDRENVQLTNNISEAASEDPPFGDEPSNIDSKEQAVPEESEQSSMQSGRHRGGRKITTRGRRRSTKTTAGDANKKTTSTLQEVDEDWEPSYSDLANVEGEKNLGGTARKRTRAKSSKRKESELDDNTSDGPADSVTGGSRKKKRGAMTVALPTPGERHYNLRRHKASAGATATGEASNSKVNDDKLAKNLGKRSKKAVLNPEQDSVLDLDVNSESIRSEHQGPISTTKSIELTSERVVRFQMPIGDADDIIEVAKPVVSMVSEEPNSVDNTFFSDEVLDTPENAEEDESGSVFVEEDESDGGDDDGSDDPGEASIGKKLWNFFTT